MSFELGLSAHYVSLTEDDCNGKSRSALLETSNRMYLQGADDTAIEAVETIAKVGNEAIEDFTQRGIYLFGTQDRIRPGIHSPFDAVMYADAANVRDGYFSHVDVSIWTDATVERESPGKLAKVLLDLCFDTPEKGKSWGVPITRDAAIVPNSGNIEPFVWGHKKDTEAVRELDVPQSLILQLQQVVDVYYKDALDKAGFGHI